MNFKDYLLERQNKLIDKKKELKKRACNTDDPDEMRGLTEDIEEVIEELNDIKEQLRKLEDAQAKKDDSKKDDSNEEDVNGDNDDKNDPNTRSIPSYAKLVNGNVLGSFNQKNSNISKRKDDIYASYEYRMAFKNYVQKGTAIPKDFQKRDNVANTETLGATIPTTLLDEFINEVQVRYGNLYAKVRKLSIPGAIKIPVAKLQATFKWVSEATVSPRQNAGDYSDYVEFSYNTAELRVAQTLLSSVAALDLFEREVVNVMMIAFLQAMDYGIVNGTGDGQMLGIINDPRVLATNNIVEMTENEINDWTSWRKNFFSKIPLGYRKGEFIFPLSTVETYLETMADANNNPVFRQATGLEVNDADAKNPNGRFFGREISLVEPDIIPDFDSASNGDVIGIFWQPEQYAINTNMEFGMRRWFDEDTNEWVNKMLTILDGKVLNPKGFWLIKKKVTA